MKNNSLINKPVMVYGFDSTPTTCYVFWETKTTITINIQITPHTGRCISGLFKFLKSTKQVYPKNMHKNYLVAFGTIPYFELIEEDKE